VITIRDVQMAAFAAADRRRFVDEMVKHVEGSYPQTPVDSPDADARAVARAHVEAAIRGAARLGARTEDAVRVVLDLLLAVGEDFDTRSEAARAVTHDPQLSGEEKVALLRLSYAPTEPAAARDDSTRSAPE
jgi:hypothetical protein